MDFDQIRDNYSAPVGERDIRDAANEGPNPADNGMLSWLGFGSDANRGLVSSDAIGERDLLSLLEGITSVTTRAASAGEMPSRHMRESAPAGGASGVIEEEGESSEESGEEEEEEAEKPKLQDFVVECGLGTGGFAAVVLVEHSKTGRIYACKTILKSRITREKQIQRIGTERRVLMHNSDHPFIATMYYAFQNHRQLFFVLDFCAGGDLYYHLTRMKNSRFKHFSEEATQFYLAELVLALEHLHNQGIVYRDLKVGASTEYIFEKYSVEGSLLHSTFFRISVTFHCPSRTYVLFPSFVSFSTRALDTVAVLARKRDVGRGGACQVGGFRPLQGGRGSPLRRTSEPVWQHLIHGAGAVGDDRRHLGGLVDHGHLNARNAHGPLSLEVRDSKRGPCRTARQIQREVEQRVESSRQRHHQRLRDSQPSEAARAPRSDRDQEPPFLLAAPQAEQRLDKALQSRLSAPHTPLQNQNQAAECC